MPSYKEISSSSLKNDIKCMVSEDGANKHSTVEFSKFSKAIRSFFKVDDSKEYKHSGLLILEVILKCS